MWRRLCGVLVCGMGEVHVIDEDGRFEENRFEGLLSESGVMSAAEFNIVSIIGPQSSGKSTVLNEAFGTRFETMNAAAGRYVLGA